MRMAQIRIFFVGDEGRRPQSKLRNLVHANSCCPVPLAGLHGEGQGNGEKEERGGNGDGKGGER